MVALVYLTTGRIVHIPDVHDVSEGPIHEHEPALDDDRLIGEGVRFERVQGPPVSFLGTQVVKVELL